MRKLFSDIVGVLEYGLPLDKNLLSDSFSYEGPSKMIGADAWFDFFSRQRSPVKIIDKASEENKLVIIFCEVDDVTLLKYRFCWFLTANDNKFIKLIEIKESVEF